ncbi:MAG: hypothetical protein JWN43_2251, partial [Gammaproteobacteria bacterium]|nr:hypothetical protein [Gammaproteobacteria bacterium]
AATVTSVTTEYDSLGHPRVEAQSLQGDPDLTIQRSFDARGLLSELEYPSKHTFRFHCDLAGRLERVEDTTRGTPNVGLPGAGARDVLIRSHVGQRRRADAFASGVGTVRSYDGAGRLMVVDHQDGAKKSLLNLTTLYDAGGNVRMDWQLGSQVLNLVTSYEYDGINRLTQAGASAAGAPHVAVFAPPSAPINPLAGQAAIDAALQLPTVAARSYQYDAGSNRVAETVAGVVTPVDSLDQQLGTTYDDAGNPVGAGAKTLSFDGRNRLVAWSDGVTNFEAIYDALGRRVWVDAEGVKKRFAYDGGADVAEYRNGQLFAESLVTSAPDGRSLLFCQGDELVIHSDRVYSTRMVTDSSGTVVGRYDFDPYGQADAASIDLPVLRHRFTGREWDGAITLYHFRARHYDPAIGAFLQRDPVDKVTGESAYRAFASNPLIYVDPMGTTASHAGDNGGWPRAWHPGEPVPEVGAIEGVKAVLKGWIHEQLHPSPKALFGLSTRLMINEVHGPDGVGIRQIYDADRHQIVMQTLVDPSNRAAVDRVTKANDAFMFSPSGGLGQLIHMAGATVLQAGAMWEGLGGFGGHVGGAEMSAPGRATVTRAAARTPAPVDTILVRKTVPIEELHFIRESGIVGRPGKWTYVTRPFDMRGVSGFESVNERLTLNYEGSTFRDTAMEMELRIPNRFRIGPGTQGGVGFTEGGAWDLTAPSQLSSSILRFRIHYPRRTSRWIAGNPFE